VTFGQHATKIGILMIAAAICLGWVVRHSEPTFADGLRYIHQAERMESEGCGRAIALGIDHPLHGLEILAVHRLLGGQDPASWQRAAFVLSFAGVVLLVIPTYLLGLALFGEHAAWLGSVLVTVNPIVNDALVNVLSESTFLFWWTFAFWCAIQYLRQGRTGWLVALLGMSSLAYLTRPEGLLLPLAVAATLAISPLFRITRLDRATWRKAIMFAIVGLVVIAGPYAVVKGGVGTKPGIARVLGLAPQAPPLGLERGKPVVAPQSAAQTYRLATIRMIRAFRVGVTAPLFPFAILGLALATKCQAGARGTFLLGIILAASAAALIRLHATGGYCTARHGLIPGMVLTLTAASAITWLCRKSVNVARSFGRPPSLVRSRSLVWLATATMAVLLAAGMNKDLGPLNPDPFAVYHATSSWLIGHADVTKDQVLDLTGWSLYLSRLHGYDFARVYEAPADPATRFIVVRRPHIDGHWYYSEIVRGLIAGRTPAAVLPADASPNQVQILIYDRQGPAPGMTATAVAAKLPR
jgi:hypothetical protein